MAPPPLAPYPVLPPDGPLPRWVVVALVLVLAVGLPAAMIATWLYLR